MLLQTAENAVVKLILTLMQPAGL